MPCYLYRAFPAGWQDDPIEKILRSNRLPGEESCHGRTPFIERRKDFLLQSNLLGQVFDQFDSDQTGHHLCQRRRINPLLFLKSDDHLPIAQSHNDPVITVDTAQVKIHINRLNHHRFPFGFRF